MKKEKTLQRMIIGGKKRSESLCPFVENFIANFVDVRLPVPPL